MIGDFVTKQTTAAIIKIVIGRSALYILKR